MSVRANYKREITGEGAPGTSEAPIRLHYVDKSCGEPETADFHQFSHQSWVEILILAFSGTAGPTDNQYRPLCSAFPAEAASGCDV